MTRSIHRKKTSFLIAHDLFVGGEFYTDDQWLSASRTMNTDGMYFLNGGKACLILIADFLLAHGIHQILLPAYLCPTIITTLEKQGLQCSYYRIQTDLSIDLEDLAKKVRAHRVMYFINYFGFPQPASVQQFLLALRQEGKLVVEDNAQGGFPAHSIGDFVFNSMRKLCAQDGGYLITRHNMLPYLEPYRGLPNRRLPIIRAYRQRLADYLLQGIGDHTELERLFQRAEAYYESDLVAEGDAQERENIERLDWAGIRQIRQENYQYLLGQIAPIPHITPIFPTLPEDCMPLGLPVYCTGVSRDAIYEALGKASIGLVIHWEELLHDSRTKGEHTVVEMASNMLTLVTDQRTSRAQLDYLVQQLQKAVQIEHKE
jgi:selenocysteine lyase/cysteine desulfurase